MAGHLLAGASHVVSLVDDHEVPSGVGYGPEPTPVVLVNPLGIPPCPGAEGLDRV
jgi:hypothetical protein